MYTLTFALGALLLLLFAQQRAHREYLWLGLTLVFSGSDQRVWWTRKLASLIPTSINAICGDPATYFWVIAQLEFAFAFTGKRPGRVVRLYEGLIFAAPFFLNPAYWFGAASAGQPGVWWRTCLVLPGLCTARHHADRMVEAGAAARPASWCCRGCFRRSVPSCPTCRMCMRHLRV